MSIEPTPTSHDAQPLSTKPVESTSTSTAPVQTWSETPATAISAKPPPQTMETTPATAPVAAEPSVTQEASVLRTEGVLGYKAPGLLKQFRFVKHFFWFADKPMTKEATDAYLKAEKHEQAHHHVAWAQETHHGVLCYAKRSEDKAAPTGIILLHEASALTKTGFNDFSFKIGTHTHKFEAATVEERDAWMAAIEANINESSAVKNEITARDSYKKTLAGFVAAPMVAGSAAAGHSHKHDKHEASPKKSLSAENTIPTPAGTAVPVEMLREHPTGPVVKDETKKERSQSRKRASVFGIFGKKDEHEKDQEKEKKVEHKAEEKHIKEEQRVEAQHKKEEAKAEHDATKAKEAAEAAAVAAVPAAAVAATETKVEKKDEKPVENGVAAHDKKTKRNSVFGGLFSKLHSPTTEKTESEVGPVMPAKNHADTSVIPAAAPKVAEVPTTKPVEQTAVPAPVAAETTAPTAVSTTAAPASTLVPAATSAPAAALAATTLPTTHTNTSTSEPVVTPRTEKKHFLAGLMKKSEKREEPVAATEPVKDTTVAEHVPETTTTTTESTPAVTTEAAKDERTAREKRRTSFFGSLGTLKRKGEKSPAPEHATTTTSPVAATTGEVISPETKREKSPMPSKLGGLFRKPSKAVKSETETAGSNGVHSAGTKEVPVTNGTSGLPLALTEQRESKLVGDVLPADLHATVHDAVTQDAPVAAATEMKKAVATA